MPEITVTTEDGRALWPREESNVGKKRFTEVEFLNFMGLRRIKVLLNPNWNKIAGKNKQGKTRFLLGVSGMIGGAKALENRPLSDGASKGHLLGKIVDDETGEEYRVERTFNERGTSWTLKHADGSKVLQKEVDRWITPLSFDPNEFSRMKPAEAGEVVKRLAPPETLAKLEELKQRQKQLEDERLMTGRDLERFGAIPAVEPAETVDVAGLTDSLKDAEKHNHEQARRAQDVELLNQRQAQYAAEVRRLEEQLAAAVARLDGVEEQIKLSPPPAALVDKTPILEALQSATAQNQRAALFQAYRVRVDEKSGLAAKYNKLDEQIAELRRQQEDLRASAKLPIPGLAMADDGPRLDGMPWTQLSDSERRRLGVMMIAALNPELPIMTMRDASLLDAESLEQVHQWAIEYGLQAIVELVGEEHEDAIIIQAGEVASAPLAQVAGF